MKVRTGCKVGGSLQFIEVELDDADMADQPGFADLATPARFKAMSQRADLMVVKYLMENGHISEEYAAQRVREIRGD